MRRTNYQHKCVGDGALDVPFRGFSRFEFVHTMWANENGRTLFAPTANCGGIEVCVIKLWGYQGLCDKFVVVMFHTVVPNVVWITQGGMGKRERDVEDAVPYMVCENINNVRITQV